jgi:hypothetical protein
MRIRAGHSGAVRDGGHILGLRARRNICTGMTAEWLSFLDRAIRHCRAARDRLRPVVCFVNDRN